MQGQRTEYNLLERECERKVLRKQERLGFDPGLRRLPLAHIESVKIGDGTLKKEPFLPKIEPKPSDACSAK